MALTKYPYSKDANISVLADEIAADPGITTALDHIDLDELPGPDTVDIWFVDAISGPEETALDAVVAAHSNPAIPTSNQVHAGSGAPSDQLGINGDLYLDPDTLLLYTKAADTWDSGQLIDDGPDTLNDLTDVTLVSPATGEVLKYDGADWINQTLAEAGIAAASHTHVEADITDLGNYSVVGHSHVEADIMDLQAYLTAEVNDLTAAVTWANVPDANVTQTSVTQHQAALSITESQISDFGSYAAASHTHVEADITDLQSYLLNINSESIDELSDVVITTPSTDQVLTYNGSNWVNAAAQGGGGALDDLTDVIITTPASDQILKYNGSNWINAADASPPSNLKTVQAHRTTMIDNAAQVWTAVTWDVTDLENDTAVLEHDNTNTERFIVHQAGLYVVGFQIGCDNFNIRLYKNGTTALDECGHAASSGTDHYVTSFGVISLAAEDYIEVQVLAAASNQDVFAGATFTMARLEGATGATGATGSSGDFSWEGTWTSQDYVVHDVVFYAVTGSCYVCHTNTIASAVPTNTSYWDIVAEKGGQGDPGIDAIVDDQYTGSDTQTQTTSASYVDLNALTVTTDNSVTLGYMVQANLEFLCSSANTTVDFKLVADGVDVPYSERSYKMAAGTSRIAALLGHVSLADAKVVKVQYKTDTGTVTVNSRNILIRGAK